MSDPTIAPRTSLQPPAHDATFPGARGAGGADELAAGGDFTRLGGVAQQMSGMLTE
jgi:hypothetical protein